MIPELSIAEDIFLGSETVNHGLIDWDTQWRRTVELLERVGLTVDPDIPIKHLGVGQQQLVEIAEALSKNVRLLILDEPTSALNETDSANLLELVRGLKNRDIACIMISHKLNEIAVIADVVTVIHGGHAVKTSYVEAGQIDEGRIIHTMVGRSIEDRFPTHESYPGEVIFEVSDWRVEDPNIPDRMVCEDSSFLVRAREIIDFAGLMGAGRTELMRSILGQNYGVHLDGSIKVRGKEIRVTSVASAIRQGVACVPGSRKTLGLNLLDNIRITTVSVNLRDILRGRPLDLGREFQVAERYRDSLNVKIHGVNSGVTTSSSGGQ